MHFLQFFQREKLLKDVMCVYRYRYAAAKSLQLCSTLCDPMDCSLPGSSVQWIFQARVLEWGAIAFLRYRYRYSIDIDIDISVCMYIYIWLKKLSANIVLLSIMVVLHSWPYGGPLCPTHLDMHIPKSLIPAGWWDDILL